MATLSPEGVGDAAALRARARRGGIDVSDDDDWSDMFSKILTLRVEPRLGMERACVLYEYPACEAALAHMPPASGVALGFDRLVMLVTGAPNINDVLWTPLMF